MTMTVEQLRRFKGISHRDVNAWSPPNRRRPDTHGRVFTTLGGRGFQTDHTFSLRHGNRRWFTPPPSTSIPTGLCFSVLSSRWSTVTNRIWTCGHGPLTARAKYLVHFEAGGDKMTRSFSYWPIAKFWLFLPLPSARLLSTPSHVCRTPVTCAGRRVTGGELLMSSDTWSAILTIWCNIWQTLRLRVLGVRVSGTVA